MARPTEREEQLIGERLSHYRILRKIGEGGRGIVYVAQDERLKRNVVLKLLSSIPAMDLTISARFRRQADVAATITHPNVAALYSVEESEGMRFLTMELVEGETLSEAVSDGARLSLARFLDYAIPITEGVKALHDVGVLHLDLKPSNVLIGKEGQVKLVDFGLASLHEDECWQDLKVPTIPGYLSPERFRGQVDQRADLYSLGVMFYVLLAGTRPFRGNTPAKLATSILRDNPPRLTTYRKDLPNRVDRILELCLAKNPEHRYRSADELLSELGALRELQAAGTVAGVSPFLPISVVRRGSGRLLTFYAAGLIPCAAALYFFARETWLLLVARTSDFPLTAALLGLLGTGTIVLELLLGLRADLTATDDGTEA